MLAPNFYKVAAMTGHRPAGPNFTSISFLIITSETRGPTAVLICRRHGDRGQNVRRVFDLVLGTRDVGCESGPMEPRGRR